MSRNFFLELPLQRFDLEAALLDLETPLGDLAVALVEIGPDAVDQAADRAEHTDRTDHDFPNLDRLPGRGRP